MRVRALLTRPGDAHATLPAGTGSRLPRSRPHCGSQLDPEPRARGGPRARGRRRWAASTTASTCGQAESEGRSSSPIQRHAKVPTLTASRGDSAGIPRDRRSGSVPAQFRPGAEPLEEDRVLGGDDAESDWNWVGNRHGARDRGHVAGRPLPPLGASLPEAAVLSVTISTRTRARECPRIVSASMEEFSGSPAPAAIGARPRPRRVGARCGTRRNESLTRAVLAPADDPAGPTTARAATSFRPAPKVRHLPPTRSHAKGRTLGFSRSWSPVGRLHDSTQGDSLSHPPDGTRVTWISQSSRSGTGSRSYFC